MLKKVNKRILYWYQFSSEELGCEFWDKGPAVHFVAGLSFAYTLKSLVLIGSLLLNYTYKVAPPRSRLQILIASFNKRPLGVSLHAKLAAPLMFYLEGGKKNMWLPYHLHCIACNTVLRESPIIIIQNARGESRMRLAGTQPQQDHHLASITRWRPVRTQEGEIKSQQSSPRVRRM